MDRLLPVIFHNSIYAKIHEYCNEIKKPKLYLELLGLYSYLYHIARIRDNYSIKASISYITKGTGLSKEKVISHRRHLEKMGLIETYIKRNDKGQIMCRYTNINYVWKRDAVDKLFYQETDQKAYPDPVRVWIEYRKEIKKPIKDQTIKSLIKDHDSDPEFFASKVDHSILNGYTGLCAPNGNISVKEKTPEVGSVMWQIEQEQKAKSGEDYIDVSHC